MGKVIDDMRNVLFMTNAQLNDIKKAMQGNNSRYMPDVAEAENKRLAENADMIVRRARQAIAARAAQEISDVKSWGHLRGDALDGASVRDDIRLLSSGLKLTRADIVAMMVRHQSNYSMVRYIEQYANENGISVFVPTVDSKVTAIEDLKNHANARLKRIHDVFGIDNFYVERFGLDLTADGDRLINGLTLDNMNAGGGDDGKTENQ